MKNDQDNHNDDIESISISADRTTCVSGQRGPAAAIFTWDAKTGEKKTRIKVAGSKAIVACALSNDGKYVAAVDGSVDHKVHVFDASNGSQKFSQNGDQNDIYDISFTNQPGEYTLCTTGKRHVCFWNFAKNEKKKGLSGKNPLGIHLCSTWDADGCAFTGFQDGKIFMWKDRQACKVIQAHKERSAVDSIRWVDNCLYSGGRDGCVKTFSTPELTPGKSF